MNFPHSRRNPHHCRLLFDSPLSLFFPRLSPTVNPRSPSKPLIIRIDSCVNRTRPNELSWDRPSRSRTKSNVIPPRQKNKCIRRPNRIGKRGRPPNTRCESHARCAPLGASSYFVPRPNRRAAGPSIYRRAPLDFKSPVENSICLCLPILDRTRFLSLRSQFSFENFSLSVCDPQR